MRTSLIVVAMAATAASVCAEDKKEILTGSNIPRTVNRVVGHSTDAVQPVYVIDRQDIDRSGATTLAQVLRKVPFVTAAGH
jgi:outer membrane cobalamin receptor